MIDELQLGALINKCKHLKYKFAGVYAADNFPPNLKNGNFIIVNSDKATQMGTQWLLLCNRNNKYLFADPLGLPLNNYPHVRDRLSFADLGVTDYTSSSAKLKLKLVWTLLPLHSVIILLIGFFVKDNCCV